MSTRRLHAFGDVGVLQRRPKPEPQDELYNAGDLDEAEPFWWFYPQNNDVWALEMQPDPDLGTVVSLNRMDHGLAEDGWPADAEDVQELAALPEWTSLMEPPGMVRPPARDALARESLPRCLTSESIVPPRTRPRRCLRPPACTAPRTGFGLAHVLMLGACVEQRRANVGAASRPRGAALARLCKAYRLRYGCFWHQSASSEARTHPSLDQEAQRRVVDSAARSAQGARQPHARELCQRYEAL
jgi:hypothetical protein